MIKLTDLLKEIYVNASGNLIGLPHPPSYKKIIDSINKIKIFVENMIEAYSDELEPDDRGWKILKLDVKDISDVIIMHGNDVFELPSSNYYKILLRIIPNDDDIDILLWTPKQSLSILNPNLIGNTFNSGIISFKYKGKLIGNDFSKDINYEYGEDKEITEGKQVGTLYHFTTLSGAIGILTSGKIRTNEDGVVSTTRDKNLNTAEFDSEGELDENIVRIDLDGDKISNNFQIKPYSFGHMGKENLEFEEQIITKKDGLPINYITNIKVIINDEGEYSYTYFDSLIKKIQEKNIPYEIQ